MKKKKMKNKKQKLSFPQQLGRDDYLNVLYGLQKNLVL